MSHRHNNKDLSQLHLTLTWRVSKYKVHKLHQSYITETVHRHCCDWVFIFCIVCVCVCSCVYVCVCMCVCVCVTFSETLKEFKAYLLENADTQSQIEALKSEVQAFSKGFPMPGFDERWRWCRTASRGGPCLCPQRISTVERSVHWNSVFDLHQLLMSLSFNFEKKKKKIEKKNDC